MALLLGVTACSYTLPPPRERSPDASADAQDAPALDLAPDSAAPDVVADNLAMELPAEVPPADAPPDTDVSVAADASHDADAMPLDTSTPVDMAMVPDTAIGVDSTVRDTVTPADTSTPMDTTRPPDTAATDTGRMDTNPYMDAAPDAASVVLFSEVSAGAFHTCGISRGRVYCWGRNDQGQVGDGTNTQRLRPVGVSLPDPATQIAAGGAHSCALTTRGNVYCWGDNGSGQLGLGHTEDSYRPMPVPLTDAVELGLGSQHSCVRTSSARVTCWGDNSRGAVGDGSGAMTVTSPTPLLTVAFVSALSVGDDHTCAVSLQGTCTTGAAAQLYCWGYNNLGQLGLSDFTIHPRPTAVARTGTPCAASYRVATGRVATLVMSEGTILATGRNDRQVFGSSLPIAASRFTTTVGLAVTRALALGIGASHACALTTGPAMAAALYCWGDNGGGQLGVVTPVSEGPPTALPFFASGSGRVPFRLAVGASHTCAIALSPTGTTEGELFCWGRGTYGQLGVGDSRDTVTPTRVGF